MWGLTISFCMFILFVGCREPLPGDVLMKMDAGLRNRVTEGGWEEISFSGRWDHEIDDGILKEIEATGVRVQSVSGEFFTARGDVKSIVHLVRMESVVRLESGKRVRPLDKMERGSR